MRVCVWGREHVSERESPREREREREREKRERERENMHTPFSYWVAICAQRFARFSQTCFLRCHEARIFRKTAIKGTQGVKKRGLKVEERICAFSNFVVVYKSTPLISICHPDIIIICFLVYINPDSNTSVWQSRRTAKFLILFLLRLQRKAFQKKTLPKNKKKKTSCT